VIETDIAALLLRATLGGTMIAHGWNHAFGGGRLPGTATWFESIGIRPGPLHATRPRLPSWTCLPNNPIRRRTSPRVVSVLIGLSLRLKKLIEFRGYIDANTAHIPNYGERFRAIHTPTTP
jgi:uncharacterized membrane protein YphA (DoxX/SURF4 family)